MFSAHAAKLCEEGGPQPVRLAQGVLWRACIQARASKREIRAEQSRLGQYSRADGSAPPECRAGGFHERGGT